jgi:hypothetical protein
MESPHGKNPPAMASAVFHLELYMWSCCAADCVRANQTRLPALALALGLLPLVEFC